MTATVDIERGDARFEKITLYVDGAEAASQSFGLASASAPAEDAELAAAQQIPISPCRSTRANTMRQALLLTRTATTTIVVGLTVQGSTAEGFSNRLEVEFDNGRRRSPDRGCSGWNDELDSRRERLVRWPGHHARDHGTPDRVLGRLG